MDTTVLERDLSLELDQLATTPGGLAALRELEDFLAREAHVTNATPRPMLLGTNGERIRLPEPIILLLREIVPLLLKGRSVALIPRQKELTTQEAADILNVSRPFLIGLLDRGEIPYFKTGTHRRIRLSDLMGYKRRRDATRFQSLNRLTELGQEDGLDAYAD